jgi:hypothetical protein
MRRTYISPEYDNNYTYGTYNMLEESNFFGSKMLEIVDEIQILDQNIIYYQNNIGEQIDISIESTLNSNIYSALNSKQINHKLVLDPSQSDFTKDSNSKWILSINLNGILSDYIFSEIKKNRTFEGIKNNMTVYNDINVGIKNYIKNNVINRYKLNTIEFYIDYLDLKTNNNFRYNNNWNYKINSSVYQLKRYETETYFDGSQIKIMFSQFKPSNLYNFDYFFNVSFKKI